MKAADLRKSILQAAVQGKLVPQDKNDEPAYELLKRIQAEKATLIKEGKLKKEKPLPPITEDKTLYDLPEGWIWCRLGELALQVDYGTSSKAHSENNCNDIPVLRMGNLQNGKVVFENLKYIDRGFVDIPFLYVMNKDLLFNRTNSFELVGKSAVYDYDDNCFTYASYLIRVRFCFLNPFFASFYINSPNCRLEQIQPNATQQNGQANFNGTKLKKIMLPIPPFAEQQRIVAKVDELMAMCDELEAAENELDALESHFFDYLPKSILQAAVQGKLVLQDKRDEPASELLKRIQAEKAVLINKGKLKKEKSLPPITEDEIPYDLPDGWAWCRLGEVCFLLDGNKQSGTFLPYLEAKVLRGTKEPERKESGKFISKGTKLILVDGENSGEIFTSHLDGYMGSTFKILYISQTLCTPYILLFIQLQKDMLRDSKKGAAIPHLNKELFFNLLVPIPPFAEQQRIIAKVNELMFLCDELKQVADQPIGHDNVIPFPVEPKENIEPIAMAARGKVEGMSDQAKQAIEDLFGEDE